MRLFCWFLAMVVLLISWSFMVVHGRSCQPCKKKRAAMKKLPLRRKGLLMLQRVAYDGINCFPSKALARVRQRIPLPELWQPNACNLAKLGGNEASDRSELQVPKPWLRTRARLLGAFFEGVPGSILSIGLLSRQVG